MAQDDGHHGHYCVWEAEQADFKVGILGTGPGFSSVLEILTTPEIQEYLPSLHLDAIAEPGPELDRLPPASRPDVPVYLSLEEMFRHHPDLNLLIELKGQKFKLSSIRCSLPADISLIDHASSFLLCGLLNMSRVSSHRRVDLDRQKALLQAIIDEVREDIVLLNKDGRVIDMNKNVYLRLGRPKQELLGLPCWEVQTLSPGQPACTIDGRDCPFRACLATGKTAEALQTRVDGQGRLRYFRVYTYPIFGRNGEITHIVEMRRDITQRTMMEKQLLISEKLASIGETSTFLAHEIRNPLFAIGGFANSLLRSGKLDDQSLRKVKVIIEEAERLDKILKSIIGFSKPLDSTITEIDVNEVFLESLELARMHLDVSHIEIGQSLGADLPRALADEELLKQCLMGVIRNAVESMPESGVLTLTTDLHDNHVRLAVADTGHGIPDAMREKVFNPFFSTKDKGYGLGLAMTKKIIEDVGGRVELTSQLGRGTTVTILLQPALSPAGRETRIDAGAQDIPSQPPTPKDNE